MARTIAADLKIDSWSSRTFATPTTQVHNVCNDKLYVMMLKWAQIVCKNAKYAMHDYLFARGNLKASVFGSLIEQSDHIHVCMSVKAGRQVFQLCVLRNGRVVVPGHEAA